MDLRASRSNNSMYFPIGCLLREASDGEILFQLNDSLRTSFKDASQSKDITIAELLKINRKMNKSKFNITVKIIIGDAGYETTPTSSKEGAGKIKTDILAKDADDETGSIYIQIGLNSNLEICIIKSHTWY